MHADESVFRDLFCFPENYNRTGILRKSQPAQYIWAGQEYNSLAAVMTLPTPIRVHRRDNSAYLR